jgi:hypothetical protein
MRFTTAGILLTAMIFAAVPSAHAGNRQITHTRSEF